MIHLILKVSIALLLLLPQIAFPFESSVLRVIDGDTIEIEGGERVRYIGVNTAELRTRDWLEKHRAREAKRFNEGLVQDKKVRLEFDKRQRDRNGRLLAYVWVNKTFVNAELVKAGLARAERHPPNLMYASTFETLESQAKEAERGLWSRFLETQVEQVIDGNSIVIEGRMRVQYIGINAPKTSQLFGQEARRTNERLVLGKRVRLELDKQREDTTGQVLAFVWVGNTFVNASLVQAGLAKAERQPPNLRYASTLERLEREAKRAKRGVWSDFLETQVERVIDGDTIVIEGGLRVQYIGIDAPESSQPLGEKARRLNGTLVLGNRVRLELDSEREDKYGRVLAYLWVGDTFVNGNLVGAGLAKAKSYPPNLRYAETLEKLEREARLDERGMWAKPRPLWARLVQSLRDFLMRIWRALSGTGSFASLHKGLRLLYT